LLAKSAVKHIGGKIMIDRKNFVWLPGEHVWPYVLGNKLDLTLLPNDWYPLDDDNINQENRIERNYIVEKPDMMISTENDIIISVSSHEFCYYDDQQLIGMHFSDFITLFDLDPSLQPDEKFGEIQLIDEVQLVYSVDSLGAQIWTYEGTIKSIIAGIIYEDDDATIRLHPFREL
jgi:hypothetical protein